MLRRDRFGFVQIRDGAGDLQNAVVGPRGERQAAHGQFQGALARLVQPAQLAQQLGGKLCVVMAAMVLNLAGALDCLAAMLLKTRERYHCLGCAADQCPWRK
jgi:hypothetical protein